ncbi:ABC transporter substrate-binding protein [Haliangium sp.]|uniref:ABC transporter substrate-binding protein n=1 Tax=Haliangium sp. TaxID=2663208 RepID=UPI003D0C5402
MAPAAAEMMGALGLLDQVVGVGDFVDWPPALRTLPRLGPYHAPSVEQVLGLRVSLLVTSRSAAASPSVARLRGLGVRVLELETSTYDGTLASMVELGRAVGKEPEARALERQIRDRMGALARRAATVPRRRVLFVVGHDPLYVAGPGSHIDEMITVAGGENIAHDAASAYQMVSLEAMLERMPEVIIDTSDNRPTAGRGLDSGAWGRWPFLPAVAEKRVYQVDPVRLVIPSPRLPEMTELLARMIHPEVFGAPAPAELGPLDAEPTPADDAEPAGDAEPVGDGAATPADAAATPRAGTAAGGP